MAAIAGFNDEKLRVYRTLIDPFGAPDQDHTPFKPRRPAGRAGCSEFGDPVGGKFESTSLAPTARGLAYGVGDGIWVAPSRTAAARAGRARHPGRPFPRLGPGRRPDPLAPRRRARSGEGACSR